LPVVIKHQKEEVKLAKDLVNIAAGSSTRKLKVFEFLLEHSIDGDETKGWKSRLLGNRMRRLARLLRH
jgi:hypothetical protein